MIYQPGQPVSIHCAVDPHPHFCCYTYICPSNLIASYNPSNQIMFEQTDLVSRPVKSIVHNFHLGDVQRIDDDL